MKTDRPSWDEVMDEFRALPTPKWHDVRRAAETALVTMLEAWEQEDETLGIQGISSSDINHTVFGAAETLYQHGLRGERLAAATIRNLHDMTL